MNNITTDIDIVKVTESRLPEVDFDNLAFGRTFTDHMLECDFKDGAWQTPKISPYHPLTIDPSARVFHYGQAIFEGMKAYKDENDKVWLFRPMENLKRLNKSAARLAMPELPAHYFIDGLKTLIDMDRNWVQKGDGNSLYIRPFMIATEPAISAAPSHEYKFMIICSPAKAYYSGDVRVMFSEKFSRSADGGVGFAKAAGNYAAQFYPTSLAQDKGFQQIVWTDANTHEYLEEAGTMNIFFRINDTLITAPTNDRILDGITRRSVIQIAEDNNIKVEVRRVPVEEIKIAARNGELKEIFGTGTAAIISPIIAFSHQGETFEFGKPEQPYSAFFKQQLMNIQYNKSEDIHSWREEV
ncbi:branched-chain amino acid aminotransferase [Mangrovimonas aestuarii]|uniref:branched-chain amino acid aminotransferase n=1 Tax=Mangrovimonas aestuarii TaxID=3018443 RepID=UPI0023789E19|nr:branched-chain amino acid aminotransferase [Mangrovimonas aestuarii]